jgi:hypothetical protein
MKDFAIFEVFFSPKCALEMCFLKSKLFVMSNVDEISTDGYSLGVTIFWPLFHKQNVFKE